MMCGAMWKKDVWMEYHRMFEDGRHPKQGHLKQVAQDHVHATFGGGNRVFFWFYFFLLTRDLILDKTNVLSKAYILTEKKSLFWKIIIFRHTHTKKSQTKILIQKNQ